MGLAIGDSLGNTTEGQLPDERQELRGEVRDYLKNWYADDRAVGVPSDDTQLAFWMLEHLMERGHIDSPVLAKPVRLPKDFRHRTGHPSLCRGNQVRPVLVGSNPAVRR